MNFASKWIKVATVRVALLVGPFYLHAQTEHPSAIPVDVVVPFAPHAVVAQGQRHLIYELHITNFGRANLTLNNVETLDPGGAVLVRYSGEELNGVLSRPAFPDATKRTIGPGLRGVVFIDVSIPASEPCPATLRHRMTFDPVQPPNAAMQSVVESPIVATVCRAPRLFGPPVEGGGWVALHALSNGSLHRRALLAIDGKARIAQRFAIDFTRIGSDGQVFHGDPGTNANWVPYGANVLAIADGRIIDIQDGIPENDPTSTARAVPITLRTVGGNYLILDLGDGEYALYAHLQPSSFRVKAGQLITRGQVLAKIGNSGQADAPHLHIHIMDAPSPLASEGLPVVFERFDLEGHLQSPSVLTSGQGWRPTASPRLIMAEMPLENDVVAFTK